MIPLAEFSIDTGECSPIAQRPHNTPLSLRDSADREMDWLIDQGYIRPLDSPWASPMVTVKKPDKTARLCVDHKRINEVTTPLPFYMPRLEEQLTGPGGSSRSWTCRRAIIYQVPTRETDVAKTAFMCHWGKFEFLRMPFGIKNAPDVFQSLMTNIMQDCSHFARPYMDDIVIFSESWDAHKDHVRQVLSCLRKAGLTANPNKCSWGVGVYMDFLGHRVGKGSMMIQGMRAEAILKYTKPTTKKSLRFFLGVVSFYQVCLHTHM